jgi:hypothetical protein
MTLAEATSSLGADRVSEADVESFWDGEIPELDKTADARDLELLLRALNELAALDSAKAADESQEDNAWSKLVEAVPKPRGLVVLLHANFDSADLKAAALAVASYLTLLRLPAAMTRVFNVYAVRSALNAVHRLATGSTMVKKVAKRGKKRKGSEEDEDSIIEASFAEVRQSLVSRPVAHPPLRALSLAVGGDGVHPANRCDNMLANGSSLRSRLCRGNE